MSAMQKLILADLESAGGTKVMGYGKKAQYTRGALRSLERKGKVQLDPVDGQNAYRVTRLKPSIPCDYCGGRAGLTSSKEIYGGRDYGPIYLCRPCNAYVGCHKGTTRPLGRVANAELRQAKIEAHAAFDEVWKARYAKKSASDNAYTKGMARGGRYKRLAELMGIAQAECHIGMFDVEQCRQVVAICGAGWLDGE